MNIENKNLGVIIKEPSGKDFIVGSTSPIVFENRNTLGDWRILEGPDERQSSRQWDTMGCVSFSAVNGSIATQLNWMIINNLLSGPTLAWLKQKGYLMNNKVNLSERFIVVRSGTSEAGNTAQNVWDAIRNQGIPPEILCPNNLEQYTREQYFNIPYGETDIVAAEWKKYFNVSYEFLSKTDIKKHLHHAPLQILTAVCSGWTTDNPIKACDQPIQHATCIMAMDSDGDFEIEDSYPPFDKRLNSDYQIPYVIKGILTPIPQKVDSFIFGRDLVFGERSTDILKLQVRLGISPTGTYDDWTRIVVRQLMIGNNIGSWFERNIWPAGRRVGPKIRTYLNTT